MLDHRDAIDDLQSPCGTGRHELSPARGKTERVVAAMTAGRKPAAISPDPRNNQRHSTPVAVLMYLRKFWPKIAALSAEVKKSHSSLMKSTDCL